MEDIRDVFYSDEENARFHAKQKAMTPPAEPTRDEMIAWCEEAAQMADGCRAQDVHLVPLKRIDPADERVLRAIAARLKEDGA